MRQLRRPGGRGGGPRDPDGYRRGRQHRDRMGQRWKTGEGRACPDPGRSRAWNGEGRLQTVGHRYWRNVRAPGGRRKYGYFPANRGGHRNAATSPPFLQNVAIGSAVCGDAGTRTGGQSDYRHGPPLGVPAPGGIQRTVQPAGTELQQLRRRTAVS